MEPELNKMLEELNKFFDVLQNLEEQDQLNNKLSDLETISRSTDEEIESELDNIYEGNENCSSEEIYHNIHKSTVNLDRHINAQDNMGRTGSSMSNISKEETDMISSFDRDKLIAGVNFNREIDLYMQRIAESKETESKKKGILLPTYTIQKKLNNALIYGGSIPNQKNNLLKWFYGKTSEIYKKNLEKAIDKESKIKEEIEEMGRKIYAEAYIRSIQKNGKGIEPPETFEDYKKYVNSFIIHRYEMAKKRKTTLEDKKKRAEEKHDFYQTKKCNHEKALNWLLKMDLDNEKFRDSISEEIFDKINTMDLKDNQKISAMIIAREKPELKIEELSSDILKDVKPNMMYSTVSLYRLSNNDKCVLDKLKTPKHPVEYYNLLLGVIDESKALKIHDNIPALLDGLDLAVEKKLGIIEAYKTILNPPERISPEKQATTSKSHDERTAEAANSPGAQNNKTNDTPNTSDSTSPIKEQKVSIEKDIENKILNDFMSDLSYVRANRDVANPVYLYIDKKNSEYISIVPDPNNKDGENKMVAIHNYKINNNSCKVILTEDQFRQMVKNNYKNFNDQISNINKSKSGPNFNNRGSR